MFKILIYKILDILLDNLGNENNYYIKALFNATTRLKNGAITYIISSYINFKK